MDTNAAVTLKERLAGRVARYAGRAPSTAQRSRPCHPSTGGRRQIGMAEIKSESVADFIPESVPDFPRNTQSADRNPHRRRVIASYTVEPHPRRDRAGYARRSAEIARLSFPQPAIGGPSLIVPREKLAHETEQLELARKGGTPITLGIALRVQGQDLAEAVGVLEATPARYELALALADHGACLRRAGQRTQAREPLRRALDLAERTGAAGLAGTVRRELLAAGARPRRAALTGPDALTAGERRVAGLAAEGASNRQIAEHLFITQATVETHLRHAFRKLGITSRADLADFDPPR